MTTFNEVRAVGFISAAGRGRGKPNSLNFAVPLGVSIADISETRETSVRNRKVSGQRGQQAPTPTPTVAPERYTVKRPGQGSRPPRAEAIPFWSQFQPLILVLT